MPYFMPCFVLLHAVCWCAEHLGKAGFHAAPLPLQHAGAVVPFLGHMCADFVIH